MTRGRVTELLARAGTHVRRFGSAVSSHPFTSHSARAVSGMAARLPVRDSCAGPALAAAVAVVLVTTAFSGVLSGLGWLVAASLAAAVVTLSGIGLRALSCPPVLVVLAQLVVVLFLLTAMYTSSGVLGFFPGPEAFSELGQVLSRALAQIRNGHLPMAPGVALTALFQAAVGMVAVLVDALVTLARAPAVSGLVLLCVFAVPASLADLMLPWWSFVLGAGGFAVLLVVDSARRRRAEWGRARRGTLRAAVRWGQHGAALAALSGVVALLAGVVSTGVGTAGRLPGESSRMVGVQPFTSLRGQLQQGRPVDLFRVRGLRGDAYLRSLTLRKFDPTRGWTMNGLNQGVPAHGRLPLPKGTTAMPPGPREHVQIQPVNYSDPWLPTFGVPGSVQVPGRAWQYDTGSGTIYSRNKRNAGTYSENMVLPAPSPQRLRNASGPMNIDPAYLDDSGVNPRIGQLARDVTAGAPTSFDRAVALNRFLRNPANGFRYTLNTGPQVTGNGLTDFLFHNRQGFCEQYASAMAVLLREVHIPSRVAVGFTPGHREGDERVITTHDAHAWVEAYFPGTGWTTFDPTPLNDGRGVVPSYLAGKLPPPPPAPAQPPAKPPANPPPQPPPASNITPAPPTTEHNAAGYAALALLAAVLAAATPFGVREVLRQRRLVRAAHGSATAAWSEFLAECADRGLVHPGTDTVRRAATHLGRELRLDETGHAALDDLVDAVEHEWYAPAGTTTGATPDRVLHPVLEAMSSSAPLTLRERAFPRSVRKTARWSTPAEHGASESRGGSPAHG